MDGGTYLHSVFGIKSPKYGASLISRGFGLSEGEIFLSPPPRPSPSPPLLSTERDEEVEIPNELFGKSHEAEERRIKNEDAEDEVEEEEEEKVEEEEVDVEEEEDGRAMEAKYVCYWPTRSPRDVIAKRARS